MGEATKGGEFSKGGELTKGGEPSKSEESTVGSRYASFLFNQASHFARVEIEQAKGTQGKGKHRGGAPPCLEEAEGVLISCLAGASIYAT